MDLSCIYARGITIKAQAVGLSAKSAAGLYRQDNTFCVFHHMYHHILGLSSRRVSLTRYTLTFRTNKVGLVAPVPFDTHPIIPVPLVEAVKA